MKKQNLVVIAAAAARILVCRAAPTNEHQVYPDIADVSHASSQAVDFFRSFFTAKTTGNGEEFLKLFNPDQAAYYDSTLGLTIAANRSQLDQIFGPSTTPDGQSYPLRILGDTTHGAVVYFVDTPGLFGAEIRTITSFDFINGTIIRQVDNWDGRGNLVKVNMTGDPTYPGLGLAGLEEKAADGMKVAVTRLNDALSSGNATAAAALFSYDAIFEDFTLRARVEGQISINSYLQRAILSLLYGPGAQVTHILGNSSGGGYEWRPTNSDVLYGITALELDECGNITRFTTTWDGSRLDDITMLSLAKLAPTP